MKKPFVRFRMRYTQDMFGPDKFCIAPVGWGGLNLNLFAAWLQCSGMKGWPVAGRRVIYYRRASQ